jgi:hypothetical protein
MAKANAVLGTRIRFLCTSHAARVPIVTMHADRWAYCPGGYIAAMEGHFWTAIEPATVIELKPKHVGLVRTQGLSRTI